MLDLDLTSDEHTAAVRAGLRQLDHVRSTAGERMRALLLGALLTSLVGSEASAQRRLRVLGTLAADSVTFRVAVRDDGDAGVLATHGASNMWCGADPRTIRD